MLLYLAAPWKDKEQMTAIAKQFEDVGHIITHKWWEIEDIPESERSADLLFATSSARC